MTPVGDITLGKSCTASCASDDLEDGTGDIWSKLWGQAGNHECERAEVR